MAKYVDANGLVYKTLVEQISDGTLAPGTKLREEAIAEQLGTSRTPVREALRTLAAEGLVEIEQNRGAKVRAWTEKQLYDSYGLRALLEGHGARLAAMKADSSTIEFLDGVQTRMEEAIRKQEPGYLDDLAELNHVFHSTINEVADNSLLKGMVGTLSSVSMVGRTFRGYREEDLQRSMIHHRDIIRGLEARDPDFVASVMTSHVLAARQAALETLR